MSSAEETVSVGRLRPVSARRLGFAAFTILVGALTTYPSVITVFRSGLESYLGIGLRQLGLLFSIGNVPAALAAVAAGVLADRYGPRVALRWGLVGTAAGLAIWAAGGRGWGAMLAGAAIIGAFTSPLGIGIHAYLVGLFPARRRRVLSLNMVAISLAGIGSPLAAEGLLQLSRAPGGMSFATVFHVPFGILAALLFWAALFYGPQKSLGAVRPAAGPGARWSQALPSAGSLMLIVLMIVHGASDVAAGVWLPRVLDSASFPVRTVAPGVVLAGYSLAYVMTRSLLAFLPEHAGRRVMLVAPGLLGGGCFLVAGVLARRQDLTAAGFVAGAFFWSFEYPAMLATVAERDPKRFGGAMALLSLGTGLATFVVVMAMGHAGEGLGEPSLWKLLLVPACGFPVVGLGGAAWVARFGQGSGRSAQGASPSTESGPRAGA